MWHRACQALCPPVTTQPGPFALKFGDHGATEWHSGVRAGCPLSPGWDRGPSSPHGAPGSREPGEGRVTPRAPIATIPNRCESSKASASLCSGSRVPWGTATRPGAEPGDIEGQKPPRKPSSGPWGHAGGGRVPPRAEPPRSRAHPGAQSRGTGGGGHGDRGGGPAVSPQQLPPRWPRGHGKGCARGQTKGHPAPVPSRSRHGDGDGDEPPGPHVPIPVPVPITPWDLPDAGVPPGRAAAPRLHAPGPAAPGTASKTPTAPRPASASRPRWYRGHKAPLWLLQPRA